uniref:Peptidase aspartic putative domain-containing protein n=1 Tax=Ditylenchus dipsaci TaxID=166011 RepID=A0A915D773_9BILA
MKKPSTSLRPLRGHCNSVPVMQQRVLELQMSRLARSADRYQANLFAKLCEWRGKDSNSWPQSRGTQLQAGCRSTKQEYGDKEAIVYELQKQLMNLPSCNSFNQAKEFHLNLEKICRQLEAMGEPLDTPLIWKPLEKKLTKQILREISKAEAKEATWNTTKLRLELGKIIREEEKLERKFLEEHKPKPSGSQHNSRHQTRQHQQSQQLANEPTMAYAAIVQAEKPKVAPIFGCCFCDLMHYPDECTKYPTVKLRQQRLLDLKRCVKCTYRNHLEQDCRRRLSCWYCSGQHTRALCPREFGQCKVHQEASSPKVQNFTPMPETQASTPATGANATPVRQPGLSIMAPPPVAGSQTLFMSAEVPVFSLDEPNKLVTAVILFDCCSHDTFASTGIKEEANLTSIGSTSFNLMKFGSTEGTPVNSSRLRVGMKNITVENGRYQVSFLGLEMLKLKNTPEHLKLYDATLQDQLRKGVIESRVTSKLRIVYDGSAKLNKQAKSLNSCLYRGPVLTSDLAGMLLRFRMPSIVITADIEKAFLQLGIREADRNVTRFFWIRDVNKEATPDNLVVPFLLAATLEAHLDKVNSPLAAHLKRNTYVDNTMISADTTEEAIELCKEAKVIYAEANMNLREFLQQ